MRTEHDIQLNDPALGRLHVPETSAAKLIEPLLTSESPSLLAHTEALTVGGIQYQISRLLLLGERGGGVPIRVGVFGGFDAGRLETVAATARLLLELELNPALARDYAVFGYPIVNAPGFGPDRVPYAALQSRWSRSPRDEDVRFFRSDLRRYDFQGIIQLRCSGVNTMFTATTRSALLAQEVVRPALDLLSPLVPVSPEPVRILSATPEGRQADYTSGRLTPEPGADHGPFEIELYAPGAAHPDQRAAALFLATILILRRYRDFISHGGEL